MNALLDLPPHLRKRLSRALATGSLPLDATETALRATTGIDDSDGSVLGAIQALGRRGLDGPGTAVLLETLEEVLARQRKPDLVWSGPKAPGVAVRDTRQVVEELIRGATRSLWMSSFVYFDGPRTFAALAKRMEEVPELRVRLLLNIQRPWGDTSAPSSLIARFAKQFWTKDWPGSRAPEVYYAPSSVELNGGGGVLHAKSIVVDDERLLVTSANLTDAGFDRNIEAGLLVTDTVLAISVTRHLAGLIDTRSLVRLNYVGTDGKEPAVHLDGTA
ncbi:MAG: DISARM system phospholipase D-like protein DrmC [Deferrisomatales bacterium]|nr:DISARM system phospholipase D-like protein DrmC [Deferrisomatales bacterium]